MRISPDHGSQNEIRFWPRIDTDETRIIQSIDWDYVFHQCSIRVSSAAKRFVLWFPCLIVFSVFSVRNVLHLQRVAAAKVMSKAPDASKVKLPGSGTDLMAATSWSQ